MAAMYFHCLLVYILKQKVIKQIRFNTKISETNLPFTNKGGIARIFVLYKKLFNIDQYVLGAALGPLSLLVILCV